jgi:hypothetical protein
MLESQEMPEHCQRTPIISHEMPRLRTSCSFTLHAPFVGKHYGYLATLTVVSHAIHVLRGCCRVQTSSHFLVTSSCRNRSTESVTSRAVAYPNGIFDSANEIADEPLWFAVQVKPTHEKRVASLFDYKRYEWFLPLYGGRRRWSDRIKLMELPLFPGYVFCRFARCARLPVLKTPSVLRIVGTGLAPTPNRRTRDRGSSESDAVRTRCFAPPLHTRIHASTTWATPRPNYPEVALFDHSPQEVNAER